ncbi:MAG: GNAT family N-acetyltransferase [Chloroflexi bacterium]|nr:GNAT family N-acetyltransferase [Chloroflexota bacterium]
MNDLRARPATRSDGIGIGEISFRSHTISFREFASASFIDEQVESEHIGWWSQVLADTTNGHQMFVTEQAGQIVGFSMVGPLNDRYEFAADVRPLGDAGSLAVLYSMHVDPDHTGHGAGRSLMQPSIEHMRAAGFRIAVLDTYEANHRARRFYESAGWELANIVVSEEGESLAIYRIQLA